MFSPSTKYRWKVEVLYLNIWKMDERESILGRPLGQSFCSVRGVRMWFQYLLCSAFSVWYACEVTTWFRLRLHSDTSMLNPLRWRSRHLPSDCCRLNAPSLLTTWAMAMALQWATAWRKQWNARMCARLSHINYISLHQDRLLSTVSTLHIVSVRIGHCWPLSTSGSCPRRYSRAAWPVHARGWWLCRRARPDIESCCPWAAASPPHCPSTTRMEERGVRRRVREIARIPEC